MVDIIDYVNLRQLRRDMMKFWTVLSKFLCKRKQNFIQRFIEGKVELMKNQNLHHEYNLQSFQMSIGKSMNDQW